MRKLIIVLMLFSLVACRSAIEKETVANQEQNIASYVNAQLADTAKTFGLVENNGSYRLIKKVGTAPEIAAGDSVYFDYIGYIFSSTKGTAFDSNMDTLGFVKKNDSGIAGVGQYIQGLDYGLVGMKTGEKAQIIFPTSLGYGDVAVGLVPPLSALLFEVEIKKVKK